MRLTLRDWANERFDGQLDDQLRQWRADGVTIDQMVRRLEDDHALTVSRETVRRWYLRAEEAVAS